MEPTVQNTICNGACTLTHAITVEELKVSGEQVEDAMALWGLFLLAGVIVLAAKSLYNRFRIDHD